MSAHIHGFIIKTGHFILDAVKQNESELENIKDSGFIFILCLNIRAIYHIENPIKIKHSYGSTDIDFLVMLKNKTKKYKEN